MSKIKIAAYGTLREGFYNHDRFNDVKKVDQKTLMGFQLWDFGPYPYAIKTNNPEDQMVVDILEVSSDAERSITRMEEGAGYSTEVINVDDSPCIIYLYPGIVNNTRQIKSGDYTQK